MLQLSVEGNRAHYRIESHQGQIQIFARNEKLNNDEKPLLSPRDPQREAQRALAGFQLKKGLLAIVLGAASIPLLQALQKNRTGGHLVVLDADSVLLRELRNLEPDAFAESVVASPEDSDRLMDFLEGLTIEELLGYRIFTQTGPASVDPKFYQGQTDLIKRTLSSRLSDLFTRLEFEPLWIKNAFMNLRHTDRAHPVSSLFGYANGMRAVLVSTGPSLRGRLNWLRENREKYFIASVDSAYRVLHRMGIEPHLIFSLDAQTFTRKHFAGLPKGNPGKYPILVADFVANPVIVRDWRGPLALSFTAQYHGNRRAVTPGCDIIEEALLPPEWTGKIPGEIQSGGSVATSVIDLLRQMGFSELVLLGQDLAFSYREIHTTGTHHTDAWLSRNVNRFSPLESINEKVIRKRATLPALSIQGKKVPSDYILSLYKKWIEDAAARLPGFLVNGTIEGMPLSGVNALNTDVETIPQSHGGLLQRFLGSPLLKSILRDPDKLIRVVAQNQMPSLEKRLGRQYSIREERLQLEDKPEMVGLKNKKEEFVLRYFRRLSRMLNSPRDSY